MQQPRERVTLVDVSDILFADNGNPYFVATFKRGLLGKPVTRTFWGRPSGDDVRWERVSPDDLAVMKGRDLSGEVFIEAVEIEPEEFVVPETGETKILTSRTIIRFMDETREQACRRCGSVLRQSRLESPGDALNALTAFPGAFSVVPTNGRR